LPSRIGDKRLKFGIAKYKKEDVRFLKQLLEAPRIVVEKVSCDGEVLCIFESDFADA